MSAYIPTELHRQVAELARGFCAYCRSAERMMGVTFEIDHITPKSSGGLTMLDNLCFACPMCNRYKTKRLLAIDPITQEAVALFHPVREVWNDHFKWIENGSQLLGLTPTGRATIVALRMNRDAIVQLRQYWIALGVHPPTF
jgi:HNH endonuclease